MFKGLILTTLISAINVAPIATFGNQINVNSDIVILLIGFTLFIVGYLLAWKTGHSWLYAISGLLWFIPITIIDNMWIIIFSIVMIIFSSILAFMKKE